jgi:H+/Cl- antiporter ClcA/CBS domain-containing protein
MNTASAPLALSSKRDFAADRRLLFLAALALPIGALGAVAAWVLLGLIRLFTNLFFFQAWSFALHSPADNTLGAKVILLPALGGLIVGVMARYGSEKIRGHGIPEAIEAILFGKSRMSPKVALLKPISSGIVIGSGGPFGAEGPIIMTGGAVGSLIGQLLHVSSAERKTLLVAGATAGMTAVFGTPVAAVLLGVELLLFEWRPRSLLPVTISCAVAGFLRPLLVADGRLFPLHTAPAGWHALLSCLAAGVASGLLSSALSRALYAVEDGFHRLPLHWMWWPAIGGLAVGVGGWLQPRALGVGYDVIGDLLNHRLVLGAALALLAAKAVMWLLALGSGTSGGILAPLLMMGAGLGCVLGVWLPGADPGLWPLVCMAAVLAGVLNAPLTAAVFAYGLTGDGDALLPLILACGVSYGLAVLLMPRSIMTERLARRGKHVHREYGVDPLERVHVEDVMTREVDTIPADTPIGQVREGWFGAAQRHRAMPVLDAQGAVLAMLDRDRLARAETTHAPDVPLAVALAGEGLMVALPEESCRAVAERVALHGLERLPVVDGLATRRLVGLISLSDLVRTRRERYEEEGVREQLIRTWPR